ncbi:MAG TPA: hypothetical protein VGR68_06560, partial [Actinomycetota bacterium]|nr:hypothetical protein [Actinomycetota bacterium]
MREPPDARPAARLAAAVRGLGRPPSGLLARVRWLFLLAALVNAVVLGTQVLTSWDAAWQLRGGAIAALAWLVSCWVADHLVARSVRWHVRAVGRERALAGVGPALFAAADPAAIHQTAVTTAVELVEAGQGIRVCLVEPDGDGVVVTAAAGDDAAELPGVRLPFDAMPPAIRAGFQQRLPVYAEQLPALRTNG